MNEPDYLAHLHELWARAGHACTPPEPRFRGSRAQGQALRRYMVNPSIHTNTIKKESA
ncbi:hypothetical protein F4827_006300 [Paraburkholderia bannensis]|uniref:Uncharacterized protein n=1 Tax=Paraburkholderia bannensis TaxID=765414 RepID=A0A7W9WUI0_9BURK|nr:hypothetical protein [Paraburkholderia bannensis]MBB3261463.1 hypothetical protein [Paraburkholderia sp. WP4_3_2]MBB6106425.1 hypothetical protein [Paraburkholderia bannensis]